MKYSVLEGLVGDGNMVVWCILMVDFSVEWLTDGWMGWVV